MKALATLMLAFALLSCNVEVTRVLDGDTFVGTTWYGSSTTYRMYGIDAPEKAQDYGMDAKANLARLILHKTVKVRKVDSDNYGRSIVKVSYDGTDVNASMVASGLAWHYYKYSNSSLYEELEVAARMNRVGLWASENYQTPPWEYRRQ
jgi:micrococcal nuclease